ILRESMFYIAILRLREPQNLQVSIMDGEVIVYWDKATDSYGHEDWTVVDNCSNITNNFCDISNYIEDFYGKYKVRVQREAGAIRSNWKQKRVDPKSTPSFTMWATSSTLTIHIHQKPILQKIYSFGVTYTIFLEEKGQNKVRQKGSDKWNDPLDYQNEKTFTSLHWGKEYCVTVKVQGTGGVTKSLSLHNALCYQSKVRSFVIEDSILIIYSARFQKSPATGWRPLSVGEGPMEVVTDKGWFLFKDETEVNRAFKVLPTTYVTDQQTGEEDRRPSTDSGVSVKPPSSDPTGREDSGCGCIGAQDSICSDFLIRDDGGDALSTCKTEDSGMGLSCHSDASSLNLEEQDSGCLHKSGEYHSQKLRTVCVHESDNEYVFKEKLPEPQLASVVSGYMTKDSHCTCSGANLCIWCHNQSHYRGKYKGLLQNNNFVESYSSYRSNNQTNNMNQIETNLTLAQMEQTFPMLTSLSSFPLMEKGRDCNMNDVSISLCDVEINGY
uniref:Fibronectin type-III domain-containing protein n=1 Tax=Neogobius melanostomus TaxID=47308 RepID=A0A8C6TUQ9_9GOBI